MRIVYVRWMSKFLVLYYQGLNHVILTATVSAAKAEVRAGNEKQQLSRGMVVTRVGRDGVMRKGAREGRYV